MMLDFCKSYADNIVLMFNNSKSYSILCSQHANLNSLDCLYIFLKPLKCVESCNYLGVKLMADVFKQIYKRETVFFVAVKNF